MEYELIPQYDHQAFCARVYMKEECPQICLPYSYGV